MYPVVLMINQMESDPSNRCNLVFRFPASSLCLPHPKIITERKQRGLLKELSNNLSSNSLYAFRAWFMDSNVDDFFRRF